MMHDYLALLADSLSSDRNAYEAIGLGANPIWLRNALVPASGTFPGLPLLRVSRNVIRTRSAEASIACQNIASAVAVVERVILAVPIIATFADLDDWRGELVASGVIDTADINLWQSFKRIRQNLANRQIIGERNSQVWLS